MRTAVCSSSAPPALGPSCCPHGIQNLESRLTRASANFNPNGFALEKWAEGLRQAPRGASWRPLIGGSRRSLSHISRTSRITPLRPSLERDKRMEWVFQKHHVFTRSAFISTHVAENSLEGLLPDNHNEVALLALGTICHGSTSLYAGSAIRSVFAQCTNSAFVPRDTNPGSPA
jgi:hypothetical protein